MRQIETVLEELEKTNNEVENYELIYNLLSDDKIDEAKDNLKTLLRITCKRKDSNVVIYKILKMVRDIYFSNREFDDVMRYHNSYIDLLNIAEGGLKWVFGDNHDLIVESNMIITDIVKNTIPDRYENLHFTSSVFEYVTLSSIHKDIDNSLLRWVSDIMRYVEILDTYLIQYELFGKQRPIADVLFREV